MTSSKAAWLLVFALTSALTTIAAPTPESFYESGTGDTTVYWISRIDPTILGEKSNAYDFVLTKPHAGVHEAMQTFADAVAHDVKGLDLAAAFLNATDAGSLTTEQANNATWICTHLSSTMAASVSDCKEVLRPRTAPQQLEKRQVLQWLTAGPLRWLRSNKHVASQTSVTVLGQALAHSGDEQVPITPRAWCHVAIDNIKACFSWSVPQPGLRIRDIAAAVNNGLAFASTNNALNDQAQVNAFNQYSVQANNVFMAGQRMSNAACDSGSILRRRTVGCILTDICISNRPNGCT